MYYADGQADNIRKANLNGSGLTTVAGASEPVDLILDIPNEYIYFTDVCDNKIKRVNFNGTGLVDIATGLNAPQGIELDKNEGKLFWSSTASKTINSINLDGSNHTIIINNTAATRLDLDLETQQIYWLERTTNLIRRSDYCGINIETITTIGAGNTTLKIDKLNEQVYWNDNATNSIKRVNFDGDR